MAVVKNLMVRAGADFSGMYKGFDQASKSMNQFKKNASGFDAGFSNAKKAVGGFDLSLKDLIKTGFGLAALKKGIDQVWSSFNAFSTVQGSGMRVNELFQGSASAINAFASNALGDLGLSKSAATEYAATYGNLFKNITADARQNANVTVGMLRASAVVASKTGRTIEDVMERIRSGLLGNTESIEDLGIHVNVAMLEISDAFRQISNGRSWQQLTFYEQQQIRTLSILEQAQKNYGNEVAQTNALITSRYTGSLQDLTVSFGQFVSVGVAPALKGLTFLTQSLTSTITSLSTTNKGIRSLIYVAGISAASLVTLSLATKGLTIAKLLYSKALNVLIVKQWGFSAAVKASLGWIGIFAAALAAIGLVAGTVYDLFSKPLNKTDGANDTLGDTADMAGAAAKKVGDLSGGLSKLEKAAKRLSSIDALNVLGQASGLATSALVDVNLTGLEDAFAGISDLQYEIKNLDMTPPVPEGSSIQRWWGDTKKLFEELSGGEGWSGFWSNWWGGVEIIGGWIQEKSATLWENIKTGWIGFWYDWKDSSRNIREWWRYRWGEFTTTVSANWEFTKTDWRNFWSNWRVGASETADWFSQTWGKFVNSCRTGNWDWLREDWDQFWRYWKSGIQAINDWFSRTWSGFLSDYGFSATAQSESGGGRGISVPKSAINASGGGRSFSAPKYATGGVVTSPTLAWVGDNGAEAVMPLEKNTGWINELAGRLAAQVGGSSPGDLIANIYLDNNSGLIGTVTARINRKSSQGGAHVLMPG